ncbi:MAG: Vps62-related protein [Verrucomicrobia bacterium]|nr:Vps62-related protein [Verrucomicrobiota bacterium]
MITRHASAVLLALYAFLASPVLAQNKSWIGVDEPLRSGQWLVAENRQFFAIMQANGDFAIYRGSGPADNKGLIWNTAFTGPGNDFFAIVQKDGSFVIYRGTGPNDNRGFLWGPRIVAEGGQFFLQLENSGDLALHAGAGPQNRGQLLWLNRFPYFPYLSREDKLSGQINPLQFRQHTDFELIWKDENDGGRSDVALWRAKDLPAGYVRLGDYAQTNYDPPALPMMIVKDDLDLVAPPTDYDLVWSYAYAATPVSIWYPRAPAGFVAMGCVAQKGLDKPPLDLLRCVRQELVSESLPIQIWSDQDENRGDYILTLADGAESAHRVASIKYLSDDGSHWEGFLVGAKIRNNIYSGPHQSHWSSGMIVRDWADKVWGVDLTLFRLFHVYSRQPNNDPPKFEDNYFTDYLRYKELNGDNMGVRILPTSEFLFIYGIDASTQSLAANTFMASTIENRPTPRAAVDPRPGSVASNPTQLDQPMTAFTFRNVNPDEITRRAVARYRETTARIQQRALAAGTDARNRRVEEVRRDESQNEQNCGLPELTALALVRQKIQLRAQQLEAARLRAVELAKQIDPASIDLRVSLNAKFEASKPQLPQAPPTPQINQPNPGLCDTIAKAGRILLRDIPELAALDQIELGADVWLENARCYSGELHYAATITNQEFVHQYRAFTGRATINVKNLGSVTADVIILNRYKELTEPNVTLTFILDPNALRSRFSVLGRPPFNEFAFSKCGIMVAHKMQSWKLSELPDQIRVQFRQVIDADEYEIKAEPGVNALMSVSAGQSGQLRWILNVLQAAPQTVLFHGIIPTSGRQEDYRFIAEPMTTLKPAAFTDKIETGPPWIVATAKPSIEMLAYMSVIVPPRDMKLKFRGYMSAAQGDGVLLAGAIEGDWLEPLEIPGLKMTSVAISGRVGDAPSIGLGGGVLLAGDPTQVSMEIPVTENISSAAFSGTKKNLGLADILRVQAGMIEVATNGRVQNPDFRNPDFPVEQFELHDVQFMAARYDNPLLKVQQGITLRGKLFFNSLELGEIDFRCQARSGVVAKSYMRGFDFGPIAVSGGGPDERRGTGDDGPMFEIVHWKQTEHPYELEQNFYIDGYARVFGSLLDAHFKLGRTRLELNLEGKMKDLYLIEMSRLADFNFAAGFNGPAMPELVMTGNFRADFIHPLQQQIDGLLLSRVPADIKGLNFKYQFNVCQAGFDVRLSDINQGIIPNLKIDAISWGQKLQVTAPFNFNDPGGSMNALAQKCAEAAAGRATALQGELQKLFTQAGRVLASFPIEEHVAHFETSIRANAQSRATDAQNFTQRALANQPAALEAVSRHANDYKGVMARISSGAEQQLQEQKNRIEEAFRNATGSGAGTVKNIIKKGKPKWHR